MKYKPSTEVKFLLERNKARVVEKVGLYWDAIHYLNMVVTFGGNRHFRSRYVTTLGPLIAIPKDSWPPESTIRHELVHVRQFRKCGLGSAWLGVPLMTIIYALLPLPMGFAWFRWLFERSANLENLEDAARFMDEAGLRYKINYIVDNLLGGGYGWTLVPFPFVKRYARKWFWKALQRRLKENKIILW